jgi:hypothetical protein
LLGSGEFGSGQKKSPLGFPRKQIGGMNMELQRKDEGSFEERVKGGVKGRIMDLETPGKGMRSWKIDLNDGEGGSTRL